MMAALPVAGEKKKKERGFEVTSLFGYALNLVDDCEGDTPFEALFHGHPQRRQAIRAWMASPLRKAMITSSASSPITSQTRSDLRYPILSAYLSTWWMAGLTLFAEETKTTPFFVHRDPAAKARLPYPGLCVTRSTGKCEWEKESLPTSGPDMFVFVNVIQTKEPVIWINPVLRPGGWCVRMAKEEVARGGQLRWTRDYFFGSVDDADDAKLQSIPLHGGRRLWYRNDPDRPIFVHERTSPDSDAALQFLSHYPYHTVPRDTLACIATVI